MSRRRNVRRRQHVAYLRHLPATSKVPWSTLAYLYNGPPHPRFVYMVGGMS